MMFNITDVKVQSWCKLHCICGVLPNQTESSRELDCPGVNEAIIIQPPGSLSGSFLIFDKQVWALYISACQPRISSNRSGYCLTLPIDSSTYFLISFLTASHILWLIALPPALRSNCVARLLRHKRPVLRDILGVHTSRTHACTGQSICQHAAHRRMRYWWWCSAENWKQTLWFIMLVGSPSGIIFMIHFLFYSLSWKQELQKRTSPSAGNNTWLQQQRASVCVESSY